MAKGKKQAQALAIKLSRERRAGKPVPPPAKGRYPEETRRRARRDVAVGRRTTGKSRRKR